MNINEYLKIQKYEFLEFLKDIDKIILVGVKDIESLEEFYKDSDNVIEEFIDENSYVVSRSDGYHELFILGSYKNYRNRFIMFLKQYYKLEPDYKLPSSLNVDHVFNKERAKNFYIRMILLDEKINKDWGRAYERLFSTLDKKNKYKNSKQYLLLDYSILLKVLEFKSFKKGDIVEKYDILKLAEDYACKLKSLFALDIPYEFIQKFYRVEINRLLTGCWNDPIEKSIKKVAIAYSFEDKKEYLKIISTCFSKDRIIDICGFDGRYFYKSDLDKNKCLEILGNLDSAKCIDYELLITGNRINSMIVRLYFESNLDERYDIFVKKV